MFSKPADPLSAPPRPAQSNAGKSVLASDLKIVGEITSSGAVEVMGEIDGTLSARSVTIGGEGRVKGSVQSETLEVKGALDGRVATGGFTLRATAKVEADITYATVVIESGAQIEGSFKLAR
ncbi:MAG: hypothetical protein CFE34_18555 [Rhodobacteraceae bacterium PARR1]|nr:MAG: hypothetical protein CFE34_18555 [Rhodobacteraceae bacterium PARR1]